MFARRRHLGLPDDLGKSLASAVNLIPAVVGGELICRAVEGEPGIRDAVGDPADDCACAVKVYRT